MLRLIQNSFSLKNQNGDVIYGDIRYPESRNLMPAVVVIHGFKAWKDWGFFPFVCSKIAGSGTLAINFSSSHCGVSPGNDEIDLPRMFAENTVSLELNDCITVINYFIEGTLNSDARQKWNGELILLGHSRGGALSIILSHSFNVSKIIAWNVIGNFVRTTKRQNEMWKSNGFLQFRDNVSGEFLRMNRTYLDDIETNSEQFDLEKSISSLDIPVCFIHAKQDMTVPYHESENLFKFVRHTDSEYFLIEGTGHTFGVRHPFVKTNKALEEVLSHTMDFIQSK